MQRLITAYRTGCEVKLNIILKHKLMYMPLSLANTCGSLHSTNKSLLTNIFTQNVQTPPTLFCAGTSCLLIDGQSLVMPLGNPLKHLENMPTYLFTLYSRRVEFQRIDITFDRYCKESITVGTRLKRKQGLHSVRKQIDSDSVPLSFDWSNCMVLEQNKCDLAVLLSNHLIDNSPRNETVIVAGGFRDAATVKSSDPAVGVSFLEAKHDELDICLILHCIHDSMEHVGISASDSSSRCSF